jgi:hypothetical protein
LFFQPGRPESCTGGASTGPFAFVSKRRRLRILRDAQRRRQRNERATEAPIPESLTRRGRTGARARTAWAKNVIWSAGNRPCAQTEWAVAFYPSSSGVVGVPRVVGGVDFGNIRYPRGTDGSEPFTLRNGHYSNQQREYEITLAGTFSGRLGNTLVALVQLSYTYAGRGYDHRMSMSPPLF